METHLKIATWINLGLGAVATVAGVGTMLMGVALGALEGDPEVFGWLSVMGAMIAAPGLPWLIGGVGVLKGNEWGRVTLVALSFVALLAIPLGTVLGWYTLWVLMNPETRRLLALRRGGHAPALAAAADPMANVTEAPRAGAAEYAEAPRTGG
jgi:hypothetical protein